jgi:hypothetical protein
MCNFLYFLLDIVGIIGKRRGGVKGRYTQTGGGLG